MKRITIIALMVTGFTIGTLSSCKKDDTSSKTTTTTDARDLAVGTYSGNTLTTYNGQSSTGTTTFTLAKGINNTIVIDGDIVTGAIVVDGNNFSGNIPTQTITDGTNTYSVQGDGLNNQQFSFKANAKTFDFTLRITGGPSDGVKIYFLGTKN